MTASRSRRRSRRRRPICAGVSVTYDGSATAPTNAGSYAVVAYARRMRTTTGHRRDGHARDREGSDGDDGDVSAGSVCLSRVLAQTPCSALMTGAGGLNAAPAPELRGQRGCGDGDGARHYAESANHLGSSDSETFTIAKAPTTTTVTCSAGPFIYSGLAQTPCSASTTGAGGLTLRRGELHGQRECGDGDGERELRGVGEPSREQRLGDVHDREGSDDDDGDLHRGAVRLSGLAQTPCSASMTGAGGLTARPP